MQSLFFIVLGALLIVFIIWEFNKFVELKNKVKQSMIGNNNPRNGTMEAKQNEI